MLLRNTSSLGDLEIAGVGFVAYGDTFEVDADTAEQLLAQVGNYEKAAPEGYDAETAKALKAEIAKRNVGRGEADQISTVGKKADLVAALEADDQRQAEDEPDGEQTTENDQPEGNPA